MKSTQVDKSRLIVGQVLVAMAVLMLLFTDYAPAGAIAMAVLGLISIGTSRKR